ncbi:hypothetical protein PFISCL1PPCAC_5799, partial [Pristionchus fissidentatus]
RHVPLLASSLFPLLSCLFHSLFFLSFIMAMRAPRIMQRKRPTPYYRNGPIEPGTSNQSGSNAVDDIDEVLDSSGCYIQDGVMIRIQDNMTTEERRILSEETVYEAAERFHAAAKERRSITVDDSAVFEENPQQPYTENRLPGIADEVESYPCRLCSDKVFLTGFGLEKHTKTLHKDHVIEVVRQIRIIGDEWRRRNLERTKMRERVQAAKYRQEALAMAAAREFRIGSNRNLRRWNPNMGDGSFHYVIPSNQLDIEPHGNTAGIIGSAGGPFEACTTCNVQINVSHPTALETHMRAHKRNEELRENMIDQMGEDAVARLTCYDCHLVFTDDKKLSAHAEAMHVRRRKFVCKWCGEVTSSVTELNEHKIDVHAMPPNGGPRPIPMMSSRKLLPPESKGGPEKNKSGTQEKNQQRPTTSSTNNADESHFSITRTSCPECDLPFNRPSLLLKHMLRVHSKYAFSASIDTKGLPSFSVQVDRGRVVWSCCRRDFNDRVSFSQHRQTHSITAVSEEELIPIGVPSSSSRIIRAETMPPAQQEVVISSENECKVELMDGSDEYPIDQSAIMDGTIEIHVPGGVKHDAMQYMLVVERGDNGEEQRRIVTIDPRENPEEMMRQHGIAMGGEVIESTSQESHSMEGANYIEDENGQIIMSSEQFEQFTMQYGDDLSNLHVLFVEDSDGNRIEDGNEETEVEREEDDTNALQHDILEPS